MKKQQHKPRSSSGQDASLSRRRPEFDSPSGRQPKWPEDFRGFGSNVRPKRQK